MWNTKDLIIMWTVLYPGENFWGLSLAPSNIFSQSNLIFMPEVGTIKQLTRTQKGKASMKAIRQ